MQDLCAGQTSFYKSMQIGIDIKFLLAGFLRWLQSTGSVLIPAVIGFITGYVSDILKTRNTEKRKKERLRRALYIEIAQLYASFKASREGLLSSLKGISEFETNFESAKKILSEKLLTQENLSVELSSSGPSENAALKTQLQRISDETSSLQKQISQIQTQFESVISMKPNLAHLFKLISLDSYRYAKSNPEIYYDLSDAWAIDNIYLHVNLVLGSVEADDIKETAFEVQSFIKAVTGAITSGAFDRALFKRVANVMLKDIEQEIADQGNKPKNEGVVPEKSN
jgi:hypothetical protein